MNSLLKKNLTNANLKIFPIAILPILLLISPFFADFTIILCGIYFIFYSVKNKNFKWVYNIYFKILFFFYIILILNCFLSQDFYLSFSRAFGFIRFPLFIIAIKEFFIVDKKSLNKILIIWSCCIFVVILDTYIQYFFGKNILGYKSWYTGNTYRLSSFLGKEYKIAGYLVPFVAIIIGYLLDTRKNAWIALFFILFSLNVIFFTGERSNLYIFYIFIFFFVIFSFLKIKIKILFFVLILINNLLLINFKSNEAQRAFEVTKEIIVSEKNKNNYFLDTHYASHYLTAYKIFLDYPLFGSGIKTFRKLCSEEKYSHKLLFNESRCSTHPHNFVLEFLSETGLIGFFFIVFFIFFTFFKTFKVARNYKSYTLLSASIIFILMNFPFLPRGSFFNNWTADIFWIVTSILISCYSLIIKNSNISKKF
jgi:O-antigen ligase